MTKFQAANKRARSPSAEKSAGNHKKVAVSSQLKLNINEAASNSSAQTTSPTISPKFSTPSKVFPVFTLSQNSRNGVLSPLPGGSNHSKTFEFRSDK